MPTTAMMVEALVGMRKEPGGIGPDYFWQLVDRFRADLVNQALVLLDSKQDAEDIAQETLCKAFLQLHQLKDPSKLGAWLRQINKCNALNLRRRRQREKEQRLSTGQVESIQAPRTSDTAQQRVRDQILKAVDSLPEPYRDVVVLRYLEKLSTDEVAIRLGVPSGTVRGQLTRADELLARKLHLLQKKEEQPR
ncbi:MAG TPA: sigma-70 family RNA polymerase sigma factor [Planctomycetota bacterium]|nr:sigma-70 family RNA polymerase sigma factor [Planctomycetota bacterium]